MKPIESPSKRGYEMMERAKEIARKEGFQAGAKALRDKLKEKCFYALLDGEDAVRELLEKEEVDQAYSDVCKGDS